MEFKLKTPPFEEHKGLGTRLRSKCELHPSSEIKSDAEGNYGKETVGIDVVLDFQLLGLDICLHRRIAGDGAADGSRRVAYISREVERHAGRALVGSAYFKEEAVVPPVPRNQVADADHDRGRDFYEIESARSGDRCGGIAFIGRAAQAKVLSAGDGRSSSHRVAVVEKDAGADVKTAE